MPMPSEMTSGVTPSMRDLGFSTSGDNGNIPEGNVINWSLILKRLEIRLDDPEVIASGAKEVYTKKVTEGMSYQQKVELIRELLTEKDIPERKELPGAA